MSNLIPISFDREFTSLCVATLHGSIIDFRFRQANMRNKGLQEHQEGDTFMENGILVEQKYIEIEGFQKRPINKWVPNSIAEFFFFDEFGFLAMSDQRIEECYGDYTETLATVYENLKKTYCALAQRIHAEGEDSTSNRREDLIDFP